MICAALCTLLFPLLKLCALLSEAGRAATDKRVDATQQRYLGKKEEEAEWQREQLMELTATTVPSDTVRAAMP